ncbi:MAG: hypothetical protein DAHOPDDO_03007 [Ignavibacteriaceae bacterium]|nr:hypothetical protein [Ignavibacteriaceae bacterium]
MNPIWESNFNIRSTDVDAFNRMKVSVVLDYFQDAASNDAERLHFGFSDFVSKGLIWVLSWAKFEFIDYPKFSDQIKIQTWPKKQYKLYSIRDYLILDSSDMIICKGTSAWLLLDSKSFRPKILTQLFPDSKMLFSKDALTELPQKINIPSITENIYSTQVRYSEIDLNQHTNNVRYVDMMVNCFDLDFHHNNVINTLTVSFNSETKFSDTIELRREKISTNPSSFYVDAVKSGNDKPVFQSMIEWKPIILTKI